MLWHGWIIAPNRTLWDVITYPCPSLIWTMFGKSVPWWRHQMEAFPRYWPFVRGIHLSPVNSPHKGQWRGALMLSLICVWINGWVNNRKTGDLGRYRAHYDVIEMLGNKTQSLGLNQCKVQSGYNTVNPLKTCTQETPHNSPSWANYEVSFVNSNSDVLPQPIHYRTKYHVILNHAITTSDCTRVWSYASFF